MKALCKCHSVGTTLFVTHSRFLVTSEPTACHHKISISKLLSESSTSTVAVCAIYPRALLSEALVLLPCYAVNNCLQIIRNTLSIPSRKPKSSKKLVPSSKVNNPRILPGQSETDSCPETSVNDYQDMLRNIPEERRS